MLVNGRSRGVSPPLKNLKLAPGSDSVLVAGEAGYSAIDRTLVFTPALALAQAATVIAVPALLLARSRADEPAIFPQRRG